MHVGDDDISAADLTEAERNVRLFKEQQSSLTIDDANDEIQRFIGRLGEARLEAERARTTMVPVDDCEGVQEVADVPVTPVPEPVRTRERVTVAEAAVAFDVSAATMRRWFRGLMPHPARDPRNPWDPGEGGAPFGSASTFPDAPRPSRPRNSSWHLQTPPGHGYPATCGPTAVPTTSWAADAMCQAATYRAAQRK